MSVRITVTDYIPLSEEVSITSDGFKTQCYGRVPNTNAGKHADPGDLRSILTFIYLMILCDRP